MPSVARRAASCLRPGRSRRRGPRLVARPRQERSAGCPPGLGADVSGFRGPEHRPRSPWHRHRPRSSPAAGRPRRRPAARLGARRPRRVIKSTRERIFMGSWLGALAGRVVPARFNFPGRMGLSPQAARSFGRSGYNGPCPFDRPPVRSGSSPGSCFSRRSARVGSSRRARTSRVGW